MGAAGLAWSAVGVEGVGLHGGLQGPSRGASSRVNVGLKEEAE